MSELPAEYRAEPELALAGGADGMDFIRRLLAEAPACMSEHAVLVLDGDEVRSAIATRPRYDDEGRDAFYETLARLAALAADQGLVVLVPATAHLRRHRARARELTPRFLEVFVDTPLGECERRDAKGLYARARLDPQSTLPGVGVPYEPPEAPEMVVRPGEADAVHRMIALMSPRIFSRRRSAMSDRISLGAALQIVV